MYGVVGNELAVGAVPPVGLELILAEEGPGEGEDDEEEEEEKPGEGEDEEAVDEEVDGVEKSAAFVSKWS